MFCFIPITRPLSSAQGYRCRSGLWLFLFFSFLITFSLSHPSTVSLFYLKSRPYPFHTSYFLKGRTLSPAPHLTKLVSVSYQLPFFHPRLSQCITTPSLLFTFFFKSKKDDIFNGLSATQNSTILSFTKKICSVKRTDNTKRVFLYVCMSTRNWKWHWLDVGSFFSACCSSASVHGRALSLSAVAFIMTAHLLL